jgi:hypothetical protein
MDAGHRVKTPPVINGTVPTRVSVLVVESKVNFST